MTDQAQVTPPVADPSTERRHLALGMGCLVGLVLACAYGFTLAPSITAGDAGELITAAWEFGVPHAPGYPLYTALGFGFSHLPFGPDPAFRMNLFSMLCCLAACLVVYVLLVRRQLHPIFAGIVALGLGSGTTWWASSVVAEVYGLNLLVLALFWLLLDADLRADRFSRATWLIGGLALTTHQTSILALLPALMLVSPTWPRAIRYQRVRHVVLLALVPCALYLLTLIAAQRPEVLAWGHPDTLVAWLKFTLLPVSQQVSSGGPLLHLNYVCELLFGEFWDKLLGITGHPAEMGAPVLLALVGLITVLQNKRGDVMQRIWGWASLLYPAVFISFTHPGVESLAKLDPYYLPMWMTLWLLVPEGYRALLASQAASPTRKYLGPLLKPVLELILALGVVITGGQSAVQNNHAGETFVRDTYTVMLTGAPQNSVLLCSLDDLFICWYLQRVEGLRPDVVPVMAYFPASSRDAYWAGWIYDDLERLHPDLAVPAVDPLPSPELSASREELAAYQEARNEQARYRLRTYLDGLLDQRVVLTTFYDPGYADLLYPPFNFRALGVGWLPQPLVWRAVTVDTEQSLSTLLGVAKFYRRGDDGVAEYTQWRQRYGDSYEHGYLLVRYMTGLVSTARLLDQLGEASLALDLYDRAIAIAPTVFEHYPPAVALAEELGDLSRARMLQQVFVQGLHAEVEAGAESLLPAWVAEATTLARLQIASGEADAAANLLAEILRIDPEATTARALQQQLLPSSGTGVP